MLVCENGLLHMVTTPNEFFGLLANQVVQGFEEELELEHCCYEPGFFTIAIPHDGMTRHLSDMVQARMKPPTYCKKARLDFMFDNGTWSSVSFTYENYDAINFDKAIDYYFEAGEHSQQQQFINKCYEWVAGEIAVSYILDRS